MVNSEIGFAESLPDEFPQIGVSNSEVVQFNCMRAWLYGYHPESKLAPKSFGPARTRGILGHKVLEEFYLQIKAGTKYDEAVKIGMEHFHVARQKAFMESDPEMLKVFNQLKPLLEMYFEHYRSDVENWEILEVESFHLLEWVGENRVYLPMKLDLVIYQRGGKFKGEVSPVDHKFTNDFWNQWKIRLNSQLPLYIKALRAAKIQGIDRPFVRRSIVNQIRTRVMSNPYPSEVFRRSFIEAQKLPMEKVFYNHLKKAIEIASLKNIPFWEAFELTSAEWGSSNCQFCDFKQLCAIELEGGNLVNEIAASYEKSDYGYPTMEELRGER